MPRELTLALAQMNCLVGDITGNVDKIIELSATARREHEADLVVFPELALTGYPPEDLLMRPEFIERCEAGLERIRRAVGGIAVLVGFPHLSKGELYNAAAVLRDGETLALYHKHLLPNYSVFDEKRYFRSGSRPAVFELAGVQVGLTVCEDIWGPAPMAQSVRAGAQLLVNINASPFHVDKQAEREAVIRERVSASPVPVVYVNMVGGQDELVFDGGSLVMDAQGRISQRAPAFEEGLYLARFRQGRSGLEPIPGEVAQIDSVASVYQALVTGVRDYIGKNRFAGAIVGLSGGVDSALTVAVAADALGAERVHAVMMPSPYTADMSLEDARAEAEALGVRYSVIPIADMAASIEKALAEEFAGKPRDTTEENIQARARRAPDGAVEQDRQAGADHRQQDRDGGRLRHAVRRHGRRLCGDQGRAQAAGLHAVPLPQRPVAGHPRTGAHARTERRAAPRPDRSGQPAALRSAGRHS